jgi:hypothetical protein
MIRSRQAKLVTNHDPEASLVFYMLQYLLCNNYPFGH